VAIATLFRALAERISSDGVFVLDVIYVAAILALIALIALVARGVEKL
jgi:hypothetical protein